MSEERSYSSPSLNAADSRNVSDARRKHARCMVDGTASVNVNTPQNVQRSDSDMLVTAAESRLYNERLQRCQVALDDNRKCHEQWVERITRRRALAKASIRRLREASRNRVTLFEQIMEHLDRCGNKGSQTPCLDISD